MKKLISVLALACLLVSYLCSCSNGSKNIWVLSDKTELASPLTIGGEEILFDDFRNWYLNLKTQMESQDEQIDWSVKENQTRLVDMTVEEIKNAMAIERIAKKYSVTLSEDELLEIDSQMEEVFNGVGGADAYKKLLSENFFTQEIYQKRLNINSLYEKLQNELIGDDSKTNKIVVSFDKAAEEFSKTHYRFARITFPVDVYDENGGEVDEKTFEKRKAEALKKANEAYAKLKSAKFLDVQKQYLSAGAEEDNQDYFEVAELSSILETEMSGVKVGEYTAPIYSQTEYYIFYRMENDNDYLSKNGKATVISTYAEKELKKMIDSEIKSLKVEKTEDFSKISTTTLI